MRSIEMPSWMTRPYLIGFETQAGEGGGEGAGEAGAGGQGDGGQGDPAGGTDPKGAGGAGEPSEDDNLGTKEDVTGLKNTVEALRKEKATLEKANKAFEKAQQTAADKDKSEVDLAKAEAERAATRLTKLASGFKTAKVNSAIIEAARAAKFNDPSDALVIDLSGVEINQDEDDPSDVTVDSKAITSLVKALAAKKPYLVGGEGAGDPSGSKFGGGSKSKKEVDAEKLKERYPSLR